MESAEVTRPSRSRFFGMEREIVFFTTPPLTSASFRLSLPMSTPMIGFAIVQHLPYSLYLDTNAKVMRASPPAGQNSPGDARVRTDSDTSPPAARRTAA